MNKQILIVDDDPLFSQIVTFTLKTAGYGISTVHSAEDALTFIQARSPDLILLDIGLPGMDGFEALTSIKQQLAVPVIFLTSRCFQDDEIAGLELGAEDYIIKPFSPDVFLAHLKAVLRRTARSSKPHAHKIRVGDLHIDFPSRTITLENKEIDISSKEFELLHVLAERPGQVFEKHELIKRVWGDDWLGEPQVIYVYIRWLRKKIEVNPSKPERLISVKGIGYKLVAVERQVELIVQDSTS